MPIIQCWLWLLAHISVFSRELQQYMKGKTSHTNIAQLELEMVSHFEAGGRKWREGNSKMSFNYLLLDPRTTKNLPARHHMLGERWICHSISSLLTKMSLFGGLIRFSSFESAHEKSLLCHGLSFNVIKYLPPWRFQVLWVMSYIKNLVVWLVPRFRCWIALL